MIMTNVQDFEISLDGKAVAHKSYRLIPNYRSPHIKFKIEFRYAPFSKVRSLAFRVTNEKILKDDDANIYVVDIAPGKKEYVIEFLHSDNIFAASDKMWDPKSNKWFQHPGNISEYWQHYNGTIYEFRMIANKSSFNPKHPIVIVYENYWTGEIFSKEINDFYEKMKPVNLSQTLKELESKNESVGRSVSST